MIITEIRNAIAGRPLLKLEEFFKLYGFNFSNYYARWNEEHPDFIGESASLFDQRTEYIKEFGFPIPCQEIIDVLLAACPLVEIGAGSGFLSKLLHDRGGDIIATDNNEGYGHIVNHGRHFSIERLAAKTAVRRYRDRNVLCSWPSYQETWFRQALKAMQIGRRLFYIEEDCTGDDGSSELLGRCFQHEQTIEIPCWNAIHDSMGIYVKKHRI